MRVTPSNTADYHCPCCGIAGIRSKFRNLRIECYKRERKQACAAYREKKRALRAALQQEMRMNEAAVELLLHRIINMDLPCPRRAYR